MSGTASGGRLKDVEICACGAGLASEMQLGTLNLQCELGYGCPARSFRAVTPSCFLKSCLVQRGRMAEESKILKARAQKGRCLGWCWPQKGEGGKEEAGEASAWRLRPLRLRADDEVRETRHASGRRRLQGAGRVGRASFCSGAGGARGAEKFDLTAMNEQIKSTIMIRIFSGHSPEGRRHTWRTEVFMHARAVHSDHIRSRLPVTASLLYDAITERPWSMGPPRPLQHLSRRPGVGQLQAP